MYNRFLNSCGMVTLPELPTSFGGGLSPLLSQVCGLLILPKGAPPPSSWVSADAVEAVIDNTVTDNSAGKWLVGRGGIDKPEEVVLNLGRRSQQVATRLYTLTYEVNIRCDGVYNFLTTLQNNYRAFNFWMNTRGGRLFGGSGGIVPHRATGWAEYSEEADEVERGFIELQWYADSEPLRTLANINPSGGGVTPTPISNVMFYQQSFPSQATNVLTWTTNSGTLPTTNTKAQILVFQEGQKLEEGAAVQYTIAHATAPGESEITINSATHYSGANYEVIAVVTS